MSFRFWEGDLLVPKQRREVFTFFYFKEVLGFVTCIWWGKN